MDPIGFGRENYDGLGRFRTTELDRDDCVIEGEGELALDDETYVFNGPAELGGLLVSRPEVTRCIVTYAFQFMAGRATTAGDDAAIAELDARFIASDGDLLSLLVELVSAPAFRHRYVGTALSGGE
jgi:hypothetical protein